MYYLLQLTLLIQALSPGGSRLGGEVVFAVHSRGGEELHGCRIRVAGPCEDDILPRTDCKTLTFM